MAEDPNLTTLYSAYAEKGLAQTQIELWQQRLSNANSAILRFMNEAQKPKIVEVIPNAAREPD